MTFRGSESPEVYIISNDINDKEVPFDTVEGNFLASLLGSYDLIMKTRMANILKQDHNEVINDIYNVKPKVIVSIGSTVEINKLFISSNRETDDISGKICDCKINDFETYFIPIFMITDLMVTPQTDEKLKKKQQELCMRFAKYLYKAKTIIDGKYYDVYKIKEILNVHSFDEFKELYEKKLIDTFDLAYDIETNARPPLAKDSKIIGFSLGNKTSGIYASVDSLDFHMSKDDEDKIWDYMKTNIFENSCKGLVIHNTMYERPYTLCCKGIEIPFDKAHDTLVMAKMLRDPGTRAKLKNQAQENLGYPDWETDLEFYVDLFKYFIDRIGNGPKGFEPIKDYILNKENIFSLVDNELSPIHALKNKEFQEEIIKKINSLKNLIKDYYDNNNEAVINIGQKYSEILAECINNGGIKDSTIPYNWIPDKLLSKYGAIDSIATIDLKDYFFERMDNESNDKVNLYKGYWIWLEHMYVGYIMERNGLYWNEKIALADYAFLSKQATRCLKEVLLSPLFKPYIFETCSNKYKALICSDYIPEIALSQGYEVEHDGDGFVIKIGGKKVKAQSLNNISLDGYMDKYLPVLETLFYDDVNNTNDWEVLKEFYNPMSPEKSNAIAFSILLTDKLNLGAKVLKLHVLSESPSFEKDKEKLTGYDKQIIKIADCCCDVDYLKNTFGDDWGFKRKEFFEGFCIRYNDRSQAKNKSIKSILNEKTPIEVDSLDDEGIISIYDNLIVTGIDPDNEKTWTDDFRWMINYRIFKKSAKIISSYIDGSVGHKSVYVVDKNDFNNKNHLVKRIMPYNANYQLSSDEAYLMSAKWSPNSADTGRWTSPLHTIPAGSQVKKYYTSRFKGGTMLMPDYAQAEVRSLAAIAHDENMLELFRSGKDFHTETAKKIFRKEEVTPAERRFSKGATFSLLYGSSVKSFAKAYCEGDESYAQMIFDGFFRAYPNVQKWVEERHKEVQRDGRVSLELSNRFITIEQDLSKGKSGLSAILRKSQNYPIQSQTADLTGGVVFDLQRYLEKNNLMSLIVMYVHDSIEVDVAPFELISVVSAFKNILIQSPLNRMGIPSKADVTLGCSLGHEIDMKDIEVISNNECILYLSGYQDEIAETIENWTSVYSLVEVSLEEYKKKLVSAGDLFIKKKAYTPTLGTVRGKGSCKVHIKY